MRHTFESLPVGPLSFDGARRLPAGCADGVFLGSAERCVVQLTPGEGCPAATHPALAGTIGTPADRVSTQTREPWPRSGLPAGSGQFPAGAARFIVSRIARATARPIGSGTALPSISLCLALVKGECLKKSRGRPCSS